ncbi:MAG TPA: N-6 DNA methylase [Stellaceae bacterium]|nr:N-6 DNA methylase [Stellaceae bacterium]
MSEEDVKIKFLVPYLEDRGYGRDSMDFGIAIEVHEGRKKKTIFADVLVYASPAKHAPILICETKPENEALSRSVKEQAISYARLLPQIAPLTLITNGSQVHVFHTLDKSRLADLPKRAELDQDLFKFVLSPEALEALRREAKHELFIIDDVTTFKGILKACHNEIRNNDGSDPTEAFDELSKVMFCKLYEEKERPKDNRFRLSVFDEAAKLNVNVVKQIFADAKKAPPYRDLMAPDDEINLQDRTVRSIVKLFESYDLGLTAFDVKGEAYEYFLSDTFTGGLGEFFTPRNVVEFMVEAVDPKIGDRIIDPFCGTGGFLIYAFELVSEKIRLQEFSDEEKVRWRAELSDRCLNGTDWKERTSQACKMNMTVHGDGSSGVFKHDGLTDIPGRIGEGQFAICITNPPFGSTETEKTLLNRYELGAGRNSQVRVILALERAIKLVKPGGWIAIVVIDGVLNNISTRYVRDYLKQNGWIRGVVSLNRETFEGYGARAKTSVLFVQRKEKPNNQQQPVFFAICSNTGYAPNGDPIPGNVLPDILLDYRAYLRGGPAGQHSNSWTCELSDRFDAEFYASGGSGIVVDVGGVRVEVETIQQKVTDTYAAIASMDGVLGDLNTEPVRLSDILEEIETKEKVLPDQTYKQLGVRWWGAGTFVREENLGSNIKAKTLKRVSAGWIIYNRLFAFRGSFAVIPPEHAGCFVSNEFPTFTTKHDVTEPDLVARYVVHCLNSPQCLQIVDAQSTGSTKTSRNRFNEKLFLAMTIHIPTDCDDLVRVVSLLDRVTELRQEQRRLADLTDKLKEGVFGMLPGVAN